MQTVILIYQISIMSLLTKIGKYTSIRSAISIVKAMKISKNINVYGYYSKQIINNNYDILIDLLAEGRLTKDFIQPKYSN